MQLTGTGRAWEGWREMEWNGTGKGTVETRGRGRSGVNGMLPPRSINERNGMEGKTTVEENEVR